MSRSQRSGDKKVTYLMNAQRHDVHLLRPFPRTVHSFSSQSNIDRSNRLAYRSHRIRCRPADLILISSPTPELYVYAAEWQIRRRDVCASVPISLARYFRSFYSNESKQSASKAHSLSDNYTVGNRDRPRLNITFSLCGVRESRFAHRRKEVRRQLYPIPDIAIWLHGRRGSTREGGEEVITVESKTFRTFMNVIRATKAFSCSIMCNA